MCDAYCAFLSATYLRTSFPLEEAEGAKSHSNYHTYGPHICY